MAARKKVGPAFNKREEDLDKWMKLMVQWGDRVRKDIQRLETRLAAIDPSFKPSKRISSAFQKPDGSAKSANSIY